MKDLKFILIITPLLGALSYLIFLHLEFGITISIGIEVLGVYYVLLDEIVTSKKAQPGNSIDLKGATGITISPAVGKLKFVRDGKLETIYHYGKFIHDEFNDALNLISLPIRIKGFYIKRFRTKEELEKFCKIELKFKVYKPESYQELEHKLEHLHEFSPIRRLGYVYLLSGLILHFIFDLITTQL